MAGTMTSRKIRDMINHIDQGRYKLPAFQREYVWKDNQIYALFDSLLLSYPIGTLLSWEVNDKHFNRFEFFNFLTFFENNNGYGSRYNPRGGDAIECFLDGQQRLTSLYIGLKGTYNKKKLYYLISSKSCINEKNINDEEVFDSSELANKHIFQFKSEKDEIIQDKDGIWFKVEAILDIKDMVDISSTFTKWNLSPDIDAMLAVEKLRKAVNDIDQHVYIIDAQSTPEEAMVIFIRSNNTGKKLNPPTIIESSLIGSNVLTRDELSQLAKDIEKSTSFNLSRKLDFFIKAIFTLLQPRVGYNVAACDNDFIIRLKQEWPQIKDCIKKTFELLNLLQFDSKDLTSINAVLPILFYNYHFKNGKLSIKDTSDAESIRRWLIVTLLDNKFSGNSDETITKTRNVFIDGWFNLKPITSFPENELYKVLELDKLSDAKLSEWLDIKYDDNKGRDWLVLKLLYEPDVNNISKMDRDHMYPKSSPELMGKDIVNSILNLQLLWGSLNRSKNDEDFNTWVINQEEESNDPSWRKKNLIPENMLFPINNFDQFIEKRRVILLDKLRNVLGIQSSGQPSVSPISSSTIPAFGNTGSNLTPKAPTTSKTKDEYQIIHNGVKGKVCSRASVFGEVIDCFLEDYPNTTKQELIATFSPSLIKDQKPEGTKNFREKKVGNESVFVNCNCWNKEDSPNGKKISSLIKHLEEIGYDKVEILKV